MDNQKWYKRKISVSSLKNNKKVRYGFRLIFVAYILITIGIFFTTDELNASMDSNTFLFIVLPSIAGVIGFGYVLIGYLEGDKDNDIKSRSETDSSTQQINELKRSIDELGHRQESNNHLMQEMAGNLAQKLDEQTELHLEKNQQKEIFDSLKKSFSDNLNEEFYKQLNENISTEISQEKRIRIESMQIGFNRIKERLSKEIDNLSRKANLNLVIGSITTIIALGSLGYLVFPNDEKVSDYTEFIYHFIPRLSLIVFIEVFAYFFLRLYKLNLNDIKYFQNELTSVELKLSSVTTAINFGKETDISKVTQELIKTERNFILKKGQSTVNRENSKNTNNDLKEILASILDIINRK